ncbi:MAG: ATP-binding protein [Deltaproteobacteria bacterium]|nr:ATP-binding protein [Deltaproteobacteria bacterium]
MLEMALHILDIAENSTRAGASLVEIIIQEDLKHDIFSIEIKDNGAGMDKETLEKTMDPFYTTKKVRRVGLGLPMLAQAARATGGSFSIESDIGCGTRVYAEFQHSHIDRQPLGDIAGVITALILGNPEVDFVYIHKKDSLSYSLDTREIRQGIGDIPLNHREVLNLIRDNVNEGLAELNG